MFIGDSNILPLLPLVLYGLLCAMLGWRNRRLHDPHHIGYVGRIMEPPDDLPPALAAWLVRPPELSEDKLLLATLLDLARRGHVAAERRTSVDDARRRRITLLRRPTGEEQLAPFERRVLNALFEDAPQIDFDQGAPAARDAIKHLAALYDAALAERGLLSDDGALRRRANTINGLIAGLLGPVAVGLVVFLVGGVAWWGWVLLLLAMLLCYALADLGADVRGTTQRGADARAAWRGFNDYLKALKPDAAPNGRLETYLAFAVAFGALKPFTAAFRASSEPLPSWYGAPATGAQTVALQVLTPEAAADEMAQFVGELGKLLSAPSGD